MGMTYKVYKVVILILAFSVILGGLYADHLPHHDFYPYFSWSLFSNTSDNDTSYFIRVTSYEGKKENSIIFAGNVSEYLNIDFLPDYYWNVQDAGRSMVERGDESGILAITSKFKQKPVNFELIEAVYDAVELKNSGAVKNVRVIKDFKII